MANGQTFMAFVFAREDEGLLSPCIRNLKRIGCDHVVVFCIETFAADVPRLTAMFTPQDGVLFVPVPETVQDEGFLKLDGPLFGAHIAAHEPDWIMALDSDEFPIVKGGHLSGLARLEKADALFAQRYNFARQRFQSGAAILADLDRLEELPLIVERENLREASGQRRWTFHKIAPKVLLRSDTFDSFTIGTHGGATKDGSKPAQFQARDIVVLHLPFTSFDRFARKVDNAKAHLDQTAIHGAQNRAWHWKEWIDRRANGTLREAFRNEALTRAEFADLRASGGIKTACELLDPASARVQGANHA